MMIKFRSKFLKSDTLLKKWESFGSYKEFFAGLLVTIAIAVTSGDIKISGAIGLCVVLLLFFLIPSSGANKDNSSRLPVGIREFATRLGTYLSTVDMDNVDNHHDYLCIERSDLLDHTSGHFHSIRYLHVKNVSTEQTSYLTYVECSEHKCKFADTNTHAYLEQDRTPLTVESIESENIPSFSHPFRIYFPLPLKPNEEIRIVYCITLPDELTALSDMNEIMSIYLGRIKKNVHQLKFTVCLDFDPSTATTECEAVTCDNHCDCPYDGERLLKNKFENICDKKWYFRELGIDWSVENPVCLSLKVKNPKHNLYKIRYMR
jgi:hypothetical protein